MTNEPLVFDIEDFRGKRIIFTKEKLERKKIDHPELGIVGFIEAVKVALREPVGVWPDFFNKEKHCYYGTYDGVYAKVVVCMSYTIHAPSRKEKYIGFCGELLRSSEEGTLDLPL